MSDFERDLEHYVAAFAECRSAPSQQVLPSRLLSQPSRFTGQSPRWSQDNAFIYREAPDGIILPKVQRAVCDDVCGIACRASDDAASNAVGMDTVKLYFPISNGLISCNHKLEISGATRCKRVLWSDDAGQRAEGAFAWWHKGGVHVLIKSSDKSPGVIFAIVTFSVAKWSGNGDNYAPGSHDETRAAFAYVAQQLKHIGVNTDFGQAIVCRLDLFRNLVMTRCCRQYGPVFDYLTPSRMTNIQYSNGRVQKNKSHQLGAYDKRVECQQRRQAVTSLPANVLRLEYRLCKAQKVQGILGYKTVDELLNNLELLPAAYGVALRKNWLKHPPQHFQQTSVSCPRQDSASPSSSLSHQKVSVVVRHLKKKLPRPFPKHLTVKALQRTLEIEGASGYKKVLDNVPELSRQYVSAAVKEINLALICDAASNNSDFAALYDEIYSKALGGLSSVLCQRMKACHEVLKPLTIPVNNPACFDRAAPLEWLSQWFTGHSAAPILNCPPVQKLPRSAAAIFEERVGQDAPFALLARPP